jgi:hypothetical protein
MILIQKHGGGGGSRLLILKRRLKLSLDLPLYLHLLQRFVSRI